MEEEKRTTNKRTIWTIVIVAVVLGLLACCCIGIVLAAGTARYTGARVWQNVPAAPELPEILRAPALPESDEVRGSGQMVEREYALGNVNSVRLTIAADLTVRLGSQPSLHIRAEDNVIDLIEVQERGGDLGISMRSGIRIVRHGPIQLTLTVPSLRAITNMGSGQINGPDMNGAEVSIHVSGSGDVSVGRIEAGAVEIIAMGSGNVRAQGVAADRLKVNISGSGSVYAGQGKVTTQDLTLMGSGSYAAGEIASLRVSANISGSGDARVQVSEELTGRLLGSGDLEYIGSPTLNANALGSGRVRQVGP
jgi:hypothetical protein